VSRETGPRTAPKRELCTADRRTLKRGEAKGEGRPHQFARAARGQGDDGARRGTARHEPDTVHDHRGGGQGARDDRRLPERAHLRAAEPGLHRTGDAAPPTSARARRAVRGGRLRLSPIGPEHRLREFASGSARLDHYLRNVALREASRHHAATLVLSPADDPGKVLGYYTLMPL